MPESIVQTRIRPATNADCAGVQQLVFDVLREYGLAPDLEKTDRDLTDLEGFYLACGGVFEIIESLDGRLLGTVGLLPLDDQVVELRKMYFLPELRGRGQGRATLTRMTEYARERGFSRIFLETATVLKEAVRLYERFGFQPTCERHTPRCDAAYFLDL